MAKSTQGPSKPEAANVSIILGSWMRRSLIDNYIGKYLIQDRAFTVNFEKKPQHRNAGVLSLGGVFVETKSK